MLTRLKQLVAIGIVLAIFFYLLSHHFVFFSLKSFDVLEKNQLTFRYTFFSMVDKTPEKVLKIDQLREAGVGELMVERGLISQEILDQLLRKIEAAQ
jgi:hypothetical protein